MSTVPSVVDDALRAPISALSSRLRVGLGLLQGLMLYGLYFTGTLKIWPATQPLLFVPLLLLALFVPVAAISAIGHLSRRNLLRWLGLLLVMLCGLGLYDAWRADLSSWLAPTANMAPYLPSKGLILLCVPGLFIAQAMVLAGNADNRRIASYPSYFEMAWKLLVQLKFSTLFTALFWLVLYLGSALFALIKLDFLKQLMEHSWFNIPITTLAFSFALHLSDARPQIVAGIRKLLLTLLSWLLPMATVLVGAFLAGLLVRGLQPLWMTGHASHVLLGACAMLVLLINTVYQDGHHLTPGKQRFFTACCRVACLLLAPLVLLAAYSQGLRVVEYGWTVSRIAAAACTLIAAVYAVGYAIAAVRVKEPLQRLAPTNIWACLAILLTMLALLSPLADPARLAVASQMHRLAQVAPEQLDASRIDFRFLRFDGARYGVDALQQLSRKQDGPHAEEVRKGATQALASANRWNMTRTPEPAANLALTIRPQPAQRSLPPAFLAQDWSKQSGNLPVCMLRADRQCEAYFVTPEPGAPEQLLIIGEESMPALFAADAQGHWQLIGRMQLNPACKQQVREAAGQGKLQWQAPLQRDLILNGVRLRTQGVPDTYQDCQAEKK